jgi:Lar family restriction alleviation protein
MSDVISPCPFCGNAAASRLDAITDVDAWVYCDACSACGPTERTEAEAIAAWNALAAQRPLVEAALTLQQHLDISNEGVALPMMHMLRLQAVCDAARRYRERQPPPDATEPLISVALVRARQKLIAAALAWLPEHAEYTAGCATCEALVEAARAHRAATVDGDNPTE